MATGATLQELEKQSTCPLCLKYFDNPVILDCGHNFCKACITNYWGESATAVSCPQCDQTFRQGSFRPNWQVANVTEHVRKLAEKRQAGRKRGVCEIHNEPLQIFCKEDQASICLLCDKAKEHKGHTTVPVEEAAEEYKVTIKIMQLSLEKRKRILVEQKKAEKRRSQKCLKQLETEMQELRSAFKQMQKQLEEKLRFRMAPLEDLEKEMKKREEENIGSFAEEISRLQNLITDMEEKCLQPTNEFLLDIKNSMNRYESSVVKKEVKLAPGLEDKIKEYTLKRPFLEKAMVKCEGILKRALDQVNVTLDVDTAHPRLVVSTDLRSVKCESRRQDLTDNPTRFDTMTCVLGRERFKSGRQLWEVEVEEKRAAGWAVGVAEESTTRKGKTSLSPIEDIWAVGKSRVGVFLPFQLSAFTFPEPTPLTLKREPRKILVSLDFENGHVGFFDADTGDSIFTFRWIPGFREKICPYFWLGSGISLKC
uniref:zinc finger protein RFP-like n=1 Tax=Euleptes europaea TaxID=460621 RepID=UPI0025403041|nr:zinc finger protein RFP-like [Euleptes europaea]